MTQHLLIALAALASAGAGPAMDADLAGAASAGRDGGTDLALADTLAVADPHGRPSPPFAIASLRVP